MICGTPPWSFYVRITVTSSVKKISGVSPAYLNTNRWVIHHSILRTQASTHVKLMHCPPMWISTPPCAIYLMSRCNTIPTAFHCCHLYQVNKKACGNGRWAAFSVTGYKCTTATENTRVHPSMTASHCHFGPTAGRRCPSRESIRRGRCPMIVRCWILCRGLISR